MSHGQVPVAADTLFIDCTAFAVEPRPLQPIFQGDRIVLQICRLPQPAFSAAPDRRALGVAPTQSAAWRRVVSGCAVYRSSSTSPFLC
jgi:hypothetical protein